MSSMDDGAPRRMLDERDILDLLPVARSTIQTWIKDKHFPAPVMIGPGRKAWFEDEVRTWQDQLKRDRD
jgi:prophage regulatory protein